MDGFKQILVPTDFGEASAEALDLALVLAKKFESKVIILHAVVLPPYYYMTYAEGVAWPTAELEGQSRKELDAAVAKAKERHANTEGVLVAGEPSAMILETSKERDADLIVMGTRGRRGLSHVVLGSVAEKIVRMSPVPVLTVSAGAERRAKEQELKGAALEAEVTVRRR